MTSWKLYAPNISCLSMKSASITVHCTYNVPKAEYTVHTLNNSPRVDTCRWLCTHNNEDVLVVAVTLTLQNDLQMLWMYDYNVEMSRMWPWTDLDGDWKKLPMLWIYDYVWRCPGCSHDLDLAEWRYRCYGFMITCEDALDAAMTLTLLNEGTDAMDLWLRVKMPWMQPWPWPCWMKVQMLWIYGYNMDVLVKFLAVHEPHTLRMIHTEMAWSSQWPSHWPDMNPQDLFTVACIGLSIDKCN